jgi:TM2 domain-containing membrane protein YozV
VAAELSPRKISEGRPVAEYFLADGLDQRGPFNPEDLVREGVRPETLVWREGMNDWTRADQVPEIQAALARVAHAPPAYGARYPATKYAPAPQYGPQPPTHPVGYSQPTHPAHYPPPTPYQQQQFPLSPGNVNNNKLAAGIVAILIGEFGVHKFMLGLNTAGIIMLLVTLLTCGVGWMVMKVIAVIEGITYLTKSDADFHRQYVVQKQEWF